jgi:chromosome segregation ATPase
MEEAFNLRSENSLLRNRITEMEIELQERDEQRREVKRQLAQVSKSNSELETRVDEFKNDLGKQVEKLQAQLEERNTEISILGSQKEVLE